jgi:hypothetical protein
MRSAPARATANVFRPIHRIGCRSRLRVHMASRPVPSARCSGRWRMAPRTPCGQTATSTPVGSPRWAKDEVRKGCVTYASFHCGRMASRTAITGALSSSLDTFTRIHAGGLPSGQHRRDDRIT